MQDRLQRWRPSEMPGCRRLQPAAAGAGKATRPEAPAKTLPKTLLMKARAPVAAPRAAAGQLQPAMTALQLPAAMARPVAQAARPARLQAKGEKAPQAKQQKRRTTKTPA